MQITRIHEDPQTAQDPVLREYVDAKAALDHAERRLKQAQDALLEQMRAKHQKSYKWTNPEGKSTSVTYVQGQTAQIDEKGLRRALTAKVFDKYTTKKLDRKRMEAAMETGEVDPMVVSRFVTMRDNNPYLKFTETRNDDA